MYSRFNISRLVEFVVALAELALGLRIILRLFAANPNASFVHWIYGTTDTLLQPFRGVFPTTVIEKSHVLDFTAMFALIVYAIAGALLVWLVAWIEGATTRTTVVKKSR